VAHPLWSGLHSTVLGYLDSFTLADLVPAAAPAEAALAAAAAPAEDELVAATTRG
jgi:hypothetical protein